MVESTGSAPPDRGPPYDVVFFDCDSTLSAVEGIDELARWAGCYDDLAALTSSAMAGAVPLEDVYGLRLERLRPDRETLERLGALYEERVVPGARDVIQALLAAGLAVHVMSGGLRPAVAALATALGVPDERVHAVDVRLDAQGRYTGYEESSPLARAGGKPELCRALLQPGERAVMIGDGVTDAEVTQVGVDFIGFGGVVVRDPVRARARRYVTDRDLQAVLPMILG